MGPSRSDCGMTRTSAAASGSYQRLRLAMSAHSGINPSGCARGQNTRAAFLATGPVGTFVLIPADPSQRAWTLRQSSIRRISLLRKEGRETRGERAHASRGPGSAVWGRMTESRRILGTSRGSRTDGVKPRRRLSIYLSFSTSRWTSGPARTALPWPGSRRAGAI